MPPVSMRQLLEAGVHFGHQTRRWNPKMRPYIFAERNGIHIIDLAQTVKRLDMALDAVRETVARGDSVLFIGTKKQAQEPIAQEATRAGQPYVNKRWLGGMLTNFVTIKKRIGLLDQLEARQQAGDFERLAKKEAALLTEELNKLLGTLGGIRKMRRLPGLVFIVDPHRERIAVTECVKLEIPITGTGDTNVDPDELDYIIPANDDAIRSIRLLCSLVADAAIEGQRERAARLASEPEAARSDGLGARVRRDPVRRADGGARRWRRAVLRAGRRGRRAAAGRRPTRRPAARGRAGRRGDARRDRPGVRSRGRGRRRPPETRRLTTAPSETHPRAAGLPARPTPQEHRQEWQRSPPTPFASCASGRARA